MIVGDGCRLYLADDKYAAEGYVECSWCALLGGDKASTNAWWQRPADVDATERRAAAGWPIDKHLYVGLPRWQWDELLWSWCDSTEVRTDLRAGLHTSTSSDYLPLWHWTIQPTTHRPTHRTYTHTSPSTSHVIIIITRHTSQRWTLPAGVSGWSSNFDSIGFLVSQILLFSCCEFWLKITYLRGYVRRACAEWGVNLLPV